MNFLNNIHMKPKIARNITIAGLLSGIVFLLICVVIPAGINVKLFFMLLCAATIIASLLFDFLICKCEYCGTHMGWFTKNSYRCKNCGRKPEYNEDNIL